MGNNDEEKGQNRSSTKILCAEIVTCHTRIKVVGPEFMEMTGSFFLYV